jgi:hypothetical protein
MERDQMLDALIRDLRDPRVDVAASEQCARLTRCQLIFVRPCAPFQEGTGQPLPSKTTRATRDETGGRSLP